VRWAILALLMLPSLCLGQSREQYFQAIDTDQSGLVSITEYQLWMRYAFDRIDSNRNDVIDEEEALVPKMQGITRSKHQANIAARFHRQDKNRDGQLNSEELTAAPLR
jgi:Ca2+-binding EF-hand superfamily protein